MDSLLEWFAVKVLVIKLTQSNPTTLYEIVSCCAGGPCSGQHHALLAPKQHVLLPLTNVALCAHCQH
jgi:hypothetical protein